MSLLSQVVIYWNCWTDWAGFGLEDFFDLSCTLLRGISEFLKKNNGISGLFAGTLSQSFATALRSSHRVVCFVRQDDARCDKLATVDLGWQHLRRSTFNRHHLPVCHSLQLCLQHDDTLETARFAGPSATANTCRWEIWYWSTYICRYVLVIIKHLLRKGIRIDDNLDDAMFNSGVSAGTKLQVESVELSG